MNQEADTENRVEPTRTGPRWKDDRVVIVPLVDEQEAGRIYHPSLLWWVLWGALLGALLLGWVGFALAEGDWTVPGLGQWAASGTAVGATTGGGIGIALGGLIGALAALYRMPPRRPGKQKKPQQEHARAERVIVEPSPDGK